MTQILSCYQSVLLQVIDLLTTEELMLTLPRVPLVPRTFQVWPGQSLLLAGLGRIDYIGGPQNIK